MMDTIMEYVVHLGTLGRSRETIEQYRRTLVRLMSSLQRASLDRWQDVEPHHLDAFMVESMTTLTGKALSFWRRRGLVSTIRGFFRWLADRGRILTSPASDLEVGVSPVTIPPRVPEAVTLDEVLDAVEHLGWYGLRNRCIFEMMYGAGLRRSEVVALDLVDLDLSEMMVSVREGKCGSCRRVPISSSASGTLQRYLEGQRRDLDRGLSSAVFLTRDGTRLSPYGLTTLSVKIKKRLGMDDLHPHLMRHAFATHLLEGGMNTRQVQDLLGHRSIESTQKYSHVDIEKLGEIVQDRHPRADMEPGYG